MADEHKSIGKDAIIRAMKAAKEKGGSGTSTGTATETATSTKTATSTDAYTQGNITVTGGAGKGATNVTIHSHKPVAGPKK